MYRFDVEDGDVVQEWTERNAHHVCRRNSVFDIQRPLIENHHGARRHDKQHGHQLI